MLSHVSTIHFPAASKRNKKHFSLELDFFSLTTVWNLIIKTFYLQKIQLKNVEKSLKSFVLFTSFDCYTNHATL